MDVSTPTVILGSCLPPLLRAPALRHSTPVVFEEYLPALVCRPISIVREDKIHRRRG